MAKYVPPGTAELRSVTQSCLTPSQPHGLQPVRLLCAWNSPGKSTGVGCRFLLQGLFPTQGSDLCLYLLHWQVGSFLPGHLEERGRQRRNIRKILVLSEKLRTLNSVLVLLFMNTKLFFFLTKLNQSQQPRKRCLLLPDGSVGPVMAAMPPS